MTPSTNYKTAITIQNCIVGIVWFLFAIITYKIFSRERFKVMNKKYFADTIVSKSITYSSLATLIIIPFTSFIHVLSSFPTICKYFIPVSYSLLYSCYIPLGLFQLSRLHYCFSAKQVHSNKGYSKWVFIIFLILAISLFIQFIIGPMLFFHVESHSNLNGFCLSKYDKEWHIFYFSSYFQLIFWDISVLLLYIYKVVQINHYHETNHSKTYTRIKQILSKIILLTLCYQIIGFIAWTTAIISELIWIVYREILTNILKAVNLWILSLCTKIMIEHNSNQYMTFIKALNKTPIYGCCKSFLSIDDTFIENQDDQDSQKLSQENDDNHVTKSDKMRKITASVESHKGPKPIHMIDHELSDTNYQ